MGEKASNREKEAKRGERIRTLRRGEETAHFNMLNLCFDPWGSKGKWRRRYVLYPNFDVTENVVIVEKNGEWAGGGTAWFREVLLKNKKILVYSAGDLFVHPDHRGRGVYSTAMRNLNQLARKKGAILGFAFPSIYRVPAMALPKYGFAKVCYPMTHVFVLKPRKFFQFLIYRAKEAFLPEKFNGITFKLTVSFDTPNGKHAITERFLVEKGQMFEFKEAPDKEHVDLAIKTEIGVLLKVACSFYLGKKALLGALTTALLLGRLRFRFSIRFLKRLLGV